MTKKNKQAPRNDLQYEQLASEYLIKATPKPIPLLNSMYHDFKNDWAGDSKIVMIRSQLGLIM